MVSAYLAKPKKLFVIAASAVQQGHLILEMVADSGAELHILCPRHLATATNRTKLRIPLQVDTAGGTVQLWETAVVVIGPLTLKWYIDPAAVHSLLSIALLEESGWNYVQGGGRAAIVKADMKMELIRQGQQWQALPGGDSSYRRDRDQSRR